MLSLHWRCSSGGRAPYNWDREDIPPRPVKLGSIRGAQQAILRMHQKLGVTLITRGARSKGSALRSRWISHGFESRHRHSFSYNNDTEVITYPPDIRQIKRASTVPSLILVPSYKIVLLVV